LFGDIRVDEGRGKLVWEFGNRELCGRRPEHEMEAREIRRRWEQQLDVWLGKGCEEELRGTRE